MANGLCDKFNNRQSSFLLRRTQKEFSRLSCLRSQNQTSEKSDWRRLIVLLNWISIDFAIDLFIQIQHRRKSTFLKFRYCYYCVSTQSYDFVKIAENYPSFFFIVIIIIQLVLLQSFVGTSLLLRSRKLKQGQGWS